MSQDHAAHNVGMMLKGHDGGWCRQKLLVGRNHFEDFAIPEDSTARTTFGDPNLQIWMPIFVPICSISFLVAPQLAGILESFPREGQIRAEVVIAFYHKVRVVHCFYVLASNKRRTGTLGDPDDRSPAKALLGL